MTDIKLFQIHSRTNLRGYRDVPIDWFVDKRDRPLFGPGGSFNVEPSDLIQDYRGSYHGYHSTDHLAECLTEDEANAVVWGYYDCRNRHGSRHDDRRRTASR